LPFSKPNSALRSIFEALSGLKNAYYTVPLKVFAAYSLKKTGNKC
jgi:hypothetical protein